VAGRACRYDPLCGNVAVEFEAPIKGGTSGSPVINSNGLLVGVISQASDTHPSTALMPRPHLALPVWIWNRIRHRVV
jgi:S1-C subfamily serine protease